MKELLFKVTAADCRWDWFNGSGPGGQNRNKTANCCRCVHEPSGAVGKSEDERSRVANQRKAFQRMAESDKFQKWAIGEAKRRTGEKALIEEKINKELVFNTVVEVKGEDGKWTEAPELQVKVSDLAYLE